MTYDDWSPALKLSSSTTQMALTGAAAKAAAPPMLRPRRAPAEMLRPRRRLAATRLAVLHVKAFYMLLSDGFGYMYARDDKTLEA